MLKQSRLAEIGALIGDPGRANMLDALMDGRALTAKELAAAAGVTPQTASGHLGKLLEAGLLTVNQQGRHRYHRLASPEIAALVESLGYLATRAEGLPGARPVHTGPRDLAMRLARTCYNHFAGRLGVGIADAMRERGLVELDSEGGAVTSAGHAFLNAFGVALPPPKGRLFCRPCLDWSERRPHLAGTVAAALACRCFDLGWVRRIDGSRAVAITPKGHEGLRSTFGQCLALEPDAAA